MSTVNFNDTVPAPPANFTNLKWQSDASGNISAYDPGGTWQTWTPTVSGQSSMTVTASTLLYARYLRMGGLVLFNVAFSATFGGTASSAALITPTPVPYVGADTVAAAPFVLSGGVPILAACQIVAGYMQINLATNFTLGTSYSLKVAGFYPCV